MVLTGFLKTKKSTLVSQTGYIAVFTAAIVVLGGYVGAAAYTITMIRNISYLVFMHFNKEPKTGFTVVFCVAYFVAAAFTTQGQLIDILPPIASCAYVLAMMFEDPVKFKTMLIANIVIWLPYYFLVGNYVLVAFDVAFFISNLVGIWRAVKSRQDAE